MKLSLVLVLTALTTLTSLAQGTIYFNNRNTGIMLNAPVQYDTGAPLGPGWSAGLFLWQQGSYSLIPGSITTFRDGSLNPLLGYFIEPLTVEVPGAPPGATVTVQMRVWLTSAGSYENSFPKGSSFDLVVANLGGGPVPPADLPSNFIGITVMIWPEPSTYALGAVGAALLFFPRRRKS